MVVANEARVIQAVSSTRRAIVEHIIEPHAPETAQRVDNSRVDLVHHRLAALGDILITARSTLQPIGRMLHNTLLAIADTTAQRAPLLTSELTTPHRNILHTTLIEADILAQHDKVGNEVYPAIAIATPHRRARAINLVSQCVKLLNIRNNVVATLPHKAKQTPHNYRGVVIVLIDNLSKLLKAIIAKGLRRVVTYIREGYRGASKGHIDPRQEALAIAQIVELRHMRATERAQSISTHIAGHSDILAEHSLADGQAVAIAIVRHIHTPNIVGFAIDT